MNYYHGEGVPQSNAAALAWACIAEVERDPNATELKNLLIGVMTPDEVDQARQIFQRLADPIISRYQRNLARGLGY